MWLKSMGRHHQSTSHVSPLQSAVKMRNGAEKLERVPFQMVIVHLEYSRVKCKIWLLFPGLPDLSVHFLWEMSISTLILDYIDWFIRIDTVYVLCFILIHFVKNLYGLIEFIKQETWHNIFTPFQQLTYCLLCLKLRFTLINWRPHVNLAILCNASLWKMLSCGCTKQDHR